MFAPTSRHGRDGRGSDGVEIIAVPTSARACDTLWPRAMLTTSCIKASLKQFRVLLTYLPRIESQIEHN
jgi:hypothetical protein